jgi:hypothetical protein
VRLPWEYTDQFRLRNSIYPTYLSLPLYLVRYLHLDTNFVVRTVPYLAHVLIVFVNDAYMWRISRRLLQKDAARLAFLLYFFNRF